MDHRKILIVDDEAMIAEELSEFLESLDYSCTSATSVDDALALINSDEAITLVLTDMRMPGKDGIDLLKALANYEDREFQCVVISGHLDADQEIAGMTAMPVSVMRKPVDIGEVVSFLESLSFVS